jgi:branched-chain amino acid transport system substrate-binding protein
MSGRSAHLSVLLAGLLLLAACTGTEPTATSAGEPADDAADQASASEDAQAEDADAQDGDAPAGEPLIIGAAVASTGFMEAYDGPPMVAVELAIEDLNAGGGVDGRPIELVTADTQSDRTVGVQAANTVLDRGAEAVIVSCDTDFGSPAAVTAQSRGVVAMSLCAGEFEFGPDGVGPLAFTMGSSTALESAVVAEWAAEQGWESVYVLRDESILYSTTLADFFVQRWEELGGTVAGLDTFSNEDASIASQIGRMQEATFDAVFLGSYVPGGATAIRQLRAAGIDAPVLGGVGFDGNYWLDSVNGDPGELYFSTYGSIVGDDPSAAVNELVERIEAATGAPPPTALSLTGYSAVEALAIAIEQAGTTEGEAVAAALESFRDQPLLVGPTSFDERLHIAVDRPMAIMTIVDGDLQFVESRRPESTPLPDGVQPSA